MSIILYTWGKQTLPMIVTYICPYRQCIEHHQLCASDRQKGPTKIIYYNLSPECCPL